MPFIDKHKKISIVQQEIEYMKKYGKYLPWWRTYSVETLTESKHFEVLWIIKDHDQAVYNYNANNVLYILFLIACIPPKWKF